MTIVKNMNTCNYPLSALLTDQYQFVMAHSYWQLHRAEQLAVFELYFRNHPFQGNYTICCGLERIVNFLKDWHFTAEEINYLSTLKSPNDEPLFLDSFLNYLSKLQFTGDVDAIPEGTIVFPHEPLLRITAPLVQCQLLETPLLNFINFATLVATKASRVCQAAENDKVIEFGFRRAQGPDGSLTAARSAFIGGCSGTSNVLAGKIYGIPVKGTLAHSWIMAFDDELSAFTEFAKTAGNNATLLVDTYDTLKGVKHAITVGQQLRKQNHDLLAIRIDSGNLLDLSKKARVLLDQAGFQNTKIFASGDLDEYVISKLKAQGAPIDMWGVGTRLATAYDQPALNGVYKLVALQNAQGQWDYKMKISNEPNKIGLPGIHQVRRYYNQNNFSHDIIYDINKDIIEDIPNTADHAEDLLIPIFRNGKVVMPLPALFDIQQKCKAQVKKFSESNIIDYKVILAPKLNQLKIDLIKKHVK